METPDDIKSQKKIAFELGAKFHINDRFESLGGCAVNVACGLQKLGVPAACYTVLGNDVDGEWIKKRVDLAGVDSSLIINENCLSGLAAIIVDEKNGERIIFSNQEANERMKVDPDKLEEAQWISVSDPNGGWKDILDTVVAAAGKTGAKMAFNPRGKNIQEDAKKVFELAEKMEIFFVNKDEAIEIVSGNYKTESDMDLNDEAYLLKKLKESEAKIIVVTDGERGAWAHDGKKIVHIEATKDKAVDTTGAGDAFSSGFLAAYIKGKDLEECVKWGVKNSGNSIRFYGGVEGLLTENEIKS